MQIVRKGHARQNLHKAEEDADLDRAFDHACNQRPGTVAPHDAPDEEPQYYEGDWSDHQEQLTFSRCARSAPPIPLANKSARGITHGALGASVTDRTLHIPCVVMRYGRTSTVALAQWVARVEDRSGIGGAPESTRTLDVCEGGTGRIAVSAHGKRIARNTRPAMLGALHCR